MKNITKFLAIIIISLSVQIINGQETTINVDKIKLLEAKKETIKNDERDRLKAEVKAINIRLEKGEVTKEEAEDLKKRQAEKRALNIESRIAIVDIQIDLLKRNKYGYDVYLNGGGINYMRIGTGDDTNEEFIFIGNKEDDKPKKYDKRTTNDLVLAFGLNNAIVDGENLDESPYKFGGSRFLELGWAWKTRVFKESNFMRFKYGFSLQMNGLKPTDNRYFVENGAQTELQESPYNLKKSKLNITNLVFPIHFEFGPSKKIEKENYFRYTTNNKFKIGIGAYGGFNIGTRQKLKYTLDGDKVKDKIKRDYNTSNLVYGLSAYLAIDEVAIYAKYDLSPIFKDQTIDQNNISIGLRFDMD